MKWDDYFNIGLSIDPIKNIRLVQSAISNSAFIAAMFILSAGNLNKMITEESIFICIEKS